MNSTTKVLRGLLLLARGRTAGMSEFANSVDALTASMAPLIAFPLVASILLILKGNYEDAAISFVSQLCVAVAPSLITYEFARIWQREENWLRTATALNWSFWIALPLILLGGLFGGVLVSIGANENIAGGIMITLMAVYMMWFHWFTLRSGLRVGNWQALGVVLLSNIAIGVLAFGPDAITMTVNGQWKSFLHGG